MERWATYHVDDYEGGWHLVKQIDCGPGPWYGAQESWHKFNIYKPSFGASGPIRQRYRVAS